MDTLVLSARYEPVARISWQRAITLVFLNKVEILEEYEDRSIQSVTFEIKMPSVIRFLRVVKRHRRMVNFSRENVYLRDKGQCQYCAQAVTRAEATYDHVVPRAQGGRTTWENVVICCLRDNQKKGNRTPTEARMRLLSLPVRPKYLPDRITVTLSWRKDMPVSWRAWLRDLTYWHGKLEED